MTSSKIENDVINQLINQDAVLKMTINCEKYANWEKYCWFLTHDDFNIQLTQLNKRTL